MTLVLEIATILGGIAAAPYLWNLIRRRWSKRKARRDEEDETALGERALALMQHQQRRNPAPLLFAPGQLASLLNVTVGTLLPVLQRLVREGRVFHDARFDMYSLEPSPWNRPGGHRLFG